MIISTKSSPRLWGCFQRDKFTPKQFIVFPTPVGVFLDSSYQLFLIVSLPHACGGVSHCAKFSKLFTVSSPRLWGCFS